MWFKHNIVSRILSDTTPGDTTKEWIDTSTSPWTSKLYDSASASWQTIGGDGSSTSSSGSINQVTKLGITASSTTPKDIDIAILATSDFKLPPVGILRFIEGTTNKVTTESTFSNSESTDFTTDSQLVFDGTMRLKNSYSFAMTDDGALGAGKQFSQIIDKTQYKTIEKVEVV